MAAVRLTLETFMEQCQNRDIALHTDSQVALHIIQILLTKEEKRKVGDYSRIHSVG